MASIPLEGGPRSILLPLTEAPGEDLHGGQERAVFVPAACLKRCLAARAAPFFPL